MGIKQHRKVFEHFLGRAILSNRRSRVHTDTFRSIRNTAANANTNNATKNAATQNIANIFATSIELSEQLLCPYDMQHLSVARVTVMLPGELVPFIATNFSFKCDVTVHISAIATKETF